MENHLSMSLEGLQISVTPRQPQQGLLDLTLVTSDNCSPDSIFMVALSINGIWFDVAKVVVAVDGREESSG